MKKTLFAATLALLLSVGFRADRAFAAGCTGTGSCYWVGGTGNWSDTTKWATTSGGATTGGLPSAADDCIFDANSSSTAYTTTVDAASTCNNLNFAAAPGSGTITWAGSSGVTISGGMTLLSGMSKTHSGSLTFDATSGTKTITRNGVTFGTTFTMTFSGAGGTWNLSDGIVASGGHSTDLTINAVGGTVSLGGDINLGPNAVSTLTNGSFLANTSNVTTNVFTSTNSNVRTVGIGSGTWNITQSGGGIPWNMSNSANATVTFTTGAIIKLTGSNATFAGGNKTYPNFWYSIGAGTGPLTVTGANTFDDFKDDGTGAHTITFPNTTTTVSSFTVSGRSGALITLSRTGASGTFTLSKSSGAVCRNYLSISNSVATGGASWVAGANSTNGGGNTGWTFSGACPTTTKNLLIQKGKLILKKAKTIFRGR